MPDMTPIIKAVVASLLDGNRSLVSPAGKTEWALLVFIGLCVAVDVFFLAMALYQYLTRTFPPSGAALVSAAIFFAAALLAAVIRKLMTREAQPPRHTSAEEELKEKIHFLMLSLFNELEEPIRDHPKTSVTIATLAGMFAGRRM